MDIEVSSKWIAFKDADIIGDSITDNDNGEIVYQFKEGDVITITNIALTEPYPYCTNVDMPLNKKELLDNFILLAELRDQRIDEILKD